jgi:hypothetical protein
MARQHRAAGASERPRQLQRRARDEFLPHQQRDRIGQCLDFLNIFTE